MTDARCLPHQATRILPLLSRVVSVGWGAAMSDPHRPDEGVAHVRHAMLHGGPLDGMSGAVPPTTLGPGDSVAIGFADIPGRWLGKYPSDHDPSRTDLLHMFYEEAVDKGKAEGGTAKGGG